MRRHMPTDLPKANVSERHASLFRNDRNQAVRIPREFEMEGTEVLMRKEGDRLTLTPTSAHESTIIEPYFPALRLKRRYSTPAMHCPR
jgi:virulence-associated protein VagC